MKKPLYTIIFLLPLLSFGQAPVINSISPTHAEVGKLVTISGSNLGGRVFFGGVESTNVTGSGNTIQAEVPAGATQGVLTVLNNTLVAQSSQHFYISFSGSDITTFDAELSPAPNTGIEDAEGICLCDLDGDDLNDVTIAHDVESTNNTENEISIYRNQSTPTNAIFTDLTTINTINNAGLRFVECGDLDNDGKPELVFVTNLFNSARHLILYRNESTPGNIVMTNLNSTIILLPNKSGGEIRDPRQAKIFDMDGDGKNDLIVGNASDNTLHIFRNTTSGPGNFTFADPVEISSGNDVSATLFVTDLNSDGRPDILTGPFGANSLLNTSSVTFLKNNSISGNFSFSEEGSISNGTNRISNISVGDFDEDGLGDLAITSRDAGIITVARNTSSGNSISFAADESITGQVSPFGLGFGDMNGDGKLDMVSARPTTGVIVFENNSTTGNISFNAPQVLTTSEGAGNLCIGDLNGDAKPDIAYTLDISAGAIGKLGVQMNRNCMQPVLSPTSAETSFCDTPDTFTVTATQSPGATYTWDVTTLNNIGGTNNFSTGTTNTATFQIVSGTEATIRVTITSQDGTCNTEFGEQTYSLIDNTQTATPTVQLNTPGPFCIGDNVIISTTTTHDSYLWTLPDGSTQTSATVNLASADISDVGTYTVRVQDTGECTSEIGSQSVVVTNPPSLAIFNNDDDVFCSDGTNNPTLEVSNVAGMSYQWNLDGSPISLETGTTYTATASGNYTVDVTDGNGCTNVTEVYTLTEVTAPVASLSGPTETCVNFETTFNSTSVTQNGFTAINDWTIVGTAPVTAPVNFTGDVFDVTLTMEGTYQLTLTTSYDSNEVSSCSDVFMQTVTVSPEPVITFSQSDDVEKCELDALTIGVNSPAATSISSYDWTVKNAEDLTVISTGTNSTIDATTPTGVDSVFAIVTITTDIGCMVTDSVKVKNFSTTADISASLFDVANDTVTLEDDNFVELSAENLVSNIAWSPASIIRDTTLSTVTVFPANSPTIVTLSGTDQNGCGVTTSITVILNNIRPRRTFSPNGDGLGFDCWEILNTSTLQGCKIYVFDSRGKNILEKDSPFANNCVWDGNYNGTPVPEGLYYFVLKCDDSNLTKSGSILLAR
ncbi:MAG: FG-GAP-like repeat-containing protein [Cyclobacteriaceae bacterium]